MDPEEAASATEAVAEHAAGEGRLSEGHARYPQEEPRPANGEAVDFDDPSLYLNRELSELAFHQRVLFEAVDDRNPLLERVKFLAILTNNLDEFFMKRIGGLKQQLEAGVTELTPDGRTPREQWEASLETCRPNYRACHWRDRSRRAPG